MKQLFKTVFFALAATVFFAACNKSEDVNYDDYYEQLAKEQKRIDSTLTAQKPILREYAMNKFDNPQYDDSTGFWFEILAPATDTSYQYTITSAGSWVTPIATVKYKGELLNGTVFDEPSQPVSMNIVEASQYNQGLIAAWPIAFRPKTITFNSKKYYTGLIDGGLKKGHKIRFVAPSPYGYDKTSSEKIPANSPLVFTIEVVDIK